MLSPLRLQHLPDFKGIETFCAFLHLQQSPCSTSLTSKGLRPSDLDNSNSAMSCSTSLTSKGLRPNIARFSVVPSLAAPPWLQRDWDDSSSSDKNGKWLAAPPWLQRDWDTLVSVLAAWTVLQHLPDFKGIETIEPLTLLTLDDLQHLPDFKGIETRHIFPQWRPVFLQHLPDSKGINIKNRPVIVTGRFFCMCCWFA